MAAAIAAGAAQKNRGGRPATWRGGGGQDAA